MVSATRARNAGFTTLELMIAVAILGILTAIALPAMAEMVANQRLRSTSSELFTSLVRARSQAIKNATDVALIPVNASWDNGWTIPHPNPTYVNYPLEKHAALRNMTIATSAEDVTYRANGRLRTTPAPSFQVAATGTTAVRCVGVDLSGRPYILKVSCP